MLLLFLPVNWCLSFVILENKELPGAFPPRLSAVMPLVVCYAVRRFHFATKRVSIFSMKGLLRASAEMATPM